MRSKTYKLLELMILFVLIPVSFMFPYPFYIKALIGLIGFAYVIYVILKLEKLRFEVNKNINWKKFWKNTLLRFITIAVITHIYVLLIAPNNLYVVVRNKPLFFLLILVVYSVLSVYPQELIYRTFFFSRYSQFFKTEKLLIFVNAVLFSLAHLFFGSALVLILTFLGGLLFATTYLKTRSTLLASIEHAIYGCWLFTVGMGSMLGFPA